MSLNCSCSKAHLRTFCLSLSAVECLRPSLHTSAIHSKKDGRTKRWKTSSWNGFFLPLSRPEVESDPVTELGTPGFTPPRYRRHWDHRTRSGFAHCDAFTVRGATGPRRRQRPKNPPQNGPKALLPWALPWALRAAESERSFKDDSIYFYLALTRSGCPGVVNLVDVGWSNTHVQDESTSRHSS